MGLKEIEVGALALKRSQSVEVRDLASQMLRDHSVAHRQLTRIAEQHHLILPPTNAFSGDRLDQIHLRNRGDAAVRERAADPPKEMKGGERMADMHSAVAAIRLLGTLSGQEFDRAYVAELVMDHATAIGIFEAAEKDLENNDLQKFAHNTLPTLRTHHHHAQNLAAKVGAPASLDANRRLRSEP